MAPVEWLGARRGRWWLTDGNWLLLTSWHTISYTFITTDYYWLSLSWSRWGWLLTFTDHDFDDGDVVAMVKMTIKRVISIVVTWCFLWSRWGRWRWYNDGYGMVLEAKRSRFARILRLKLRIGSGDPFPVEIDDEDPDPFELSWPGTVLGTSARWHMIKIVYIWAFHVLRHDPTAQIAGKKHPLDLCDLMDNPMLVLMCDATQAT